jgi:hypothetical protein
VIFPVGRNACLGRKMKSLIGTTIGLYQLTEEIGNGAAAVVYKAYQPSLERWVALKILDPACTAGNMESLARFRREARAIAALRHPNILMLYDCGEQDDLQYIAMEYVAGGTLKSRLMGAPFDWKRAAGLAIGIGQALAFAHSRGIVHRDVKPANVLLPRDDWPLLADFGLAKIKQLGPKITGPGVSVGTPAYTSPEQALGGPVDHRADIYALGAVLFEMITGRPPFDALRQYEVLFRHIKEPPRQPRLLASEIPGDLDRLILKALQKNADDRYDQMLEMVADLESLGGQGVGTRPARAASQSRPSGTVTAELPSVRLLSGDPHFIIVDTGAPVPVPLQDQVLIGRTDPATNSEVDIDLTDLGGLATGVSRQHARLVHDNSIWSIEDLGSTNGTCINNQLLTPFSPRALRDGDIVELGQMVLAFHAGRSGL